MIMGEALRVYSHRLTMYLRKGAQGHNLRAMRTTSLHRERSSAKTVYLSGPAQGRRKYGNDITKCRFAPFRYIGPRVKPAAMHLWLSATSHISRFSKSLRQVQALGLMDFVNPRPVI